MHKPGKPLVAQFCALLLLMPAGGAFAQDTPYPPWVAGSVNSSTPQDLSRIVAQSEAYFNQRGRGPRRGYKHYRRWLWFAQQRLSAGGLLLNDQAAAQLACQASPTDRSAVAWRALGPTSFGLAPGSGFNGGLGHVAGITVGPSGTVFVATATGGLWKRARGEDWVPLTNQEVPVPVLSSVILDPNDPETIFILTGDGDGRSAPSLGVLMSIDGGTSWHNIGPRDFGSQTAYGYRMAISRPGGQGQDNGHDNSQPIVTPGTVVLLAATTSGVYRAQGSPKQWAEKTHSADWQQVLPPDDNGDGYYEVVFHPTIPSILYAAGVTGVFGSTDGGSSWSRFEGLPPDIDSERVALAVTPAAPDSLYVLYGGSVGYQGLYVSTDTAPKNGGPATFELRSNSPNLLSYEPEGTSFLGSGIPTYVLTVAVSPTDPDRIRVGSQMVWESVDGGVDWRLTSYWDDRARRATRVSFIHNDIHEIVDLGSTIYVASDGGVSTSRDSGQTWQDQSAGLNITQMYRLSSTPQDQDVVFFSAQDNGSSVLRGGVATQVVDYDGTAFLVDPSDVQKMFIGYQTGGLFRSRPPSPGSIETRLVDAAPPLSYPATSSFVTPVVMDSPSLYGCYVDLWQSTDGAMSWTNLSKAKIGTALCSALAVSSGAIYLAKGTSWLDDEVNDASVWRRTDADKWVNITHELEVNWISDVVIDPDEPGRAWLSAAGYMIDNVYQLTGQSPHQSWQPLPGLPQVPIYSLVRDDQTDALYAGSWCGVYRYDPQSASWSLDSNGMPRMLVMDLAIQKYPDGSRALYAGTLAQGAWRLELAAGAAAIPR